LTLLKVLLLLLPALLLMLLKVQWLLALPLATLPRLALLLPVLLLLTLLKLLWKPLPRSNSLPSKKSSFGSFFYASSLFVLQLCNR
jgi:hypothetical protein